MRIVSLALITLLAACSGTAEEPAAPAEPTPPVEEPKKEKAKAKAKAEGPGTEAGVNFSTPADGAVVKSPLKVGFQVSGMEVRPAGDLSENTGHHHLIVDGAPIPAGTIVPKDATHMHYGKGQVEATVELTPGKHTLTMQFADGNHMSYGPDYAKTITVKVEE